jgi:hypothetical protein
MKTVSDFVQCDVYSAMNIPAINLLETNELQKLTVYADKQRLLKKYYVHSVDTCLSVARLCVVHRAICSVLCAVHIFFPASKLFSTVHLIKFDILCYVYSETLI